MRRSTTLLADDIEIADLTKSEFGGEGSQPASFVTQDIVPTSL